jgi:phosphoglycolate phosphatase
MPSPHDFILFDLDGTLSDPLIGVSRSINYALTHCGYETRPVAEIAQQVGPSLDRAFQALIGQDLDTTALVAKYRDRYGEVGYSENILYPGVPEALAAIHTAQIPMGICTAKRQDFAEQILSMFDLRHHFQFINGGEVGISKVQQIKFLLSTEQVSESTVMIGDRSVDLIAAHQNNLVAGGVLWGYGSTAELADESPLYLFNSPQELSQLVKINY